MAAQMVYQFSKGARLPKEADAQAIGDRLARLRSTLGKGYGLDAVVDDARDPSSPLHPAFDGLWEMSGDEAIRKVLEEQAAYIVRHIRILVERKRPDGASVHEQRPAFVSVVERQSEERRYIPVVQVMTDADYREQALEDAFRYFWAGRERFKDFTELARIFAVIDEVARVRRASKLATDVQPTAVA
jgi:hypothetical protein